MLFGSGRKPKYLERTRKHRGRAWKLHPERIWDLGDNRCNSVAPQCISWIFFLFDIFITRTSQWPWKEDGDQKSFKDIVRFHRLHLEFQKIPFLHVDRMHLLDFGLFKDRSSIWKTLPLETDRHSMRRFVQFYQIYTFWYFWGKTFGLCSEKKKLTDI